MENKTYWLHWYPSVDKFILKDRQNNELGEKADKLFWPSIKFENAQGTAMMQAYETGQVVEMDVSEQQLDLREDYKSLGNVRVVATPKIDDNGVEYIHCLYTVGE